MRILHTADWHLGDRYHHFDRTAEIRANVGRIAALCVERRTDVLLVAGDLFSEQVRLRDMSGHLEHLRTTFAPFLAGGGTVVALTGNHDHASTCAALTRAIDMATPPGAGVAAPGRFYLAGEPRWLRLRARAGETTPFILLPYPTRHGYLPPGCRASRRGELNAALREAFLDRARALRREAGCSPEQPGVLAAHVNMLPGAAAFRLEAPANVVVPAGELPGAWSYVALGHIHRAQQVPAPFPIYYPGSIERLDFGERNNPVGVLLLDIVGGVVRDLKTIPLPAREFLEATLAGPEADFVPPAAANALVRVQLQFVPAPHDLQLVHHRVRERFPHCFEIRYPRPESPGAAEVYPPPGRSSERGLVVAYLEQQTPDEAERNDLKTLVDQVLAEIDELPEEPVTAGQDEEDGE